ncbi:hypothetical protein CEXT_809811 [Caerostris extrusa]|uniref:Uncharacterized protein n=1 Tax=Caerostris extrusa TaxID=172846 RepID=A0AAV4X064_CAEEX|nr:hypothetical protein CEXT_809811 [Caerostris extrusa]
MRIRLRITNPQIIIVCEIKCLCEEARHFLSICDVIYRAWKAFPIERATTSKDVFTSGITNKLHQIIFHASNSVRGGQRERDSVKLSQVSEKRDERAEEEKKNKIK